MIHRNKSISAGTYGDYPAWIGRSDCRSCDILKEVIFSALSSKDLDDIVKGIYEPIDRLVFKNGSSLYQEGNEDNAIYTIRSGLVKLVRHMPDGSERIIRLTKRADSIGLERLLKKAYGHTAIAINEVCACRIPIGVIKNFDHRRPRFYMALMERWATSVFQADDYITLLLSGSVRDRLSRLIRWLSTMTDSSTENAVQLLSGKDMAAMLDVSTESISRTMAELKRNKILRHIDGELYQYNPEMLDQYASIDYHHPHPGETTH